MDVKEQAAKCFLHLIRCGFVWAGALLMNQGARGARITSGAFVV
jgi:hypothetical protein